MQEGGNNGVCLEHQFFGGDSRDRDRMEDVWFARLTELRSMRLAGEFEGILDPGKIFC